MMKILKILISGRILTSILMIFMLSFMTILSSCTATIRTPRHARTNVVIRSQGDYDNNGRSERQERRERRERREHHDRD